MKKTIVLLVVFLSTITLYSQEDKSKIEILEEAVKISSVNNVDIKTGGNGKVYYNSKEIATIDQLSNIDISNLEDLKMKDRSSGAPIVLTDFLEILGTNSSWKAFVGSSVTNKPEGLPTGTYRIVSFGSNGQNFTQQQGVAIAFKGTNGDAYLISRDENSILKARQIVTIDQLPDLSQVVMKTSKLPLEISINQGEDEGVTNRYNDKLQLGTSSKEPYFKLTNWANSYIEGYDTNIDIKAFDGVYINALNYGLHVNTLDGIYLNDKEVATVDQLQNISNIENLKMKDRSSGAPVTLTNFYEVLGSNSSWKAFVGSSVTNKPEGLPTGTYRIMSFGSSGQNSTQQQGVAIAVKGTDGESFLISRDESGTLKATTMIPKPIDYSTSEQKTGQKWVDGKDVYQRTYYQFGISTNKQDPTRIQGIGIPSSGNIIKTEGYLRATEENHISWGSSDLHINTDLGSLKTILVYSTATIDGNLYDGSILEAYITLYYTK